MANVLFGSISDANEWVYHYTTLAIGLEALLPSGTLRLGPFKSVTDPRESKSWFFSVSHEDGVLLDAEEFFKLQKRAKATVKGNCKIQCTTRDDPRIVIDGPDYSFHRGYSRPRMRAHYGDSHRGMCLILDRKALHNQIKTELGNKGALYRGSVCYVNTDYNEVSAFNLKYEDILESSLHDVLRKKVEQHYWSYFFTKAEDWESELEWRWVICGEDSEPELVSIEKSLRAIVLGADFPRAYEPAVVPFGERYGIPVARIHWRNGRPTIVPGPYEP